MTVLLLIFMIIGTCVAIGICINLICHMLGVFPDDETGIRRAPAASHDKVSAVQALNADIAWWQEHDRWAGH